MDFKVVSAFLSDSKPKTNSHYYIWSVFRHISPLFHQPCTKVMHHLKSSECTSCLHQNKMKKPYSGDTAADYIRYNYKHILRYTQTGFEMMHQSSTESTTCISCSAAFKKPLGHGRLFEGDCQGVDGHLGHHHLGWTRRRWIYAVLC